jgi:phosphoenolpyruvate synthase/pyruvate phosphate dikinase
MTQEPIYIRWFREITLDYIPSVCGKNASLADLAVRARKAREYVISAGIPEDLRTEIREANDKLCEEYGRDSPVAIGSSATAEDLPTASFAGQQETYLNISGYAALKEACSKCFASLFTDRAICCRIDNGFDHFKVALPIGIMKMVRPDPGHKQRDVVLSPPLTVLAKTLSRAWSALMNIM